MATPKADHIDEDLTELNARIAREGANATSEDQMTPHTKASDKT